MRAKNIFKGLTVSGLLMFSFSASALTCHDIQDTSWKVENEQGLITLTVNSGDNNQPSVAYSYSYYANHKVFHLYPDIVTTQCHASDDGSVTLDMESSVLGTPWTKDLHVKFNSADQADLELDFARKGKITPIKATLHRS